MVDATDINEDSLEKNSGCFQSYEHDTIGYILLNTTRLFVQKIPSRRMFEEGIFLFYENSYL